MRLLILLVSAFLTAFAGGGVVARTASGSAVVAAAAENVPSSEERARQSPLIERPFAPPSRAAIGWEKASPGPQLYPIYADRLRL